jgi:hypothetical protein
MKKIFFTLAMTLAGYFSYAQTNNFSSLQIDFSSVNGDGLHVYNGGNSYLSLIVNGSTGYGVPNWANSTVLESVPVSTGGLVFSSYTGDINLQTNNRISRMTIASNGNVGIGITNPSTLLHILKSSVAYTNIPMQEWDPAVAGYNLTLSNYNSAYGIDYRFTQFTNGVSQPVLTFQGGSVGIGTTSPDTKLAVNGTIHSTEVKVDLSVPGPDYVFNADYKLTDLNDLKAYLEKNHHLPEIPSADQMAKEGINLSDMNIKLLKKVEELTLYLIKKDGQVSNQSKQLSNQDKQITDQGKEIEQQQQVNQSLQKQINELAKKLNK